jgi:hypothetical protein
MSTTFSRRAGIACLALVAAVFLAVPIAYLASSPQGVIDACVNPGNGGLRLVDSAAACHNNETHVQWNVVGPAGPVGPAGLAGPPGASSGGPPYVWICSPANFPGTGSNPRHDIYVFNGSTSNANVSVNILDRDGNNLLGHTVPGSNPAAVYPGQANNSTVSVLPAHTLNVNWFAPQTAQPASDGVTDVAFSVRVTSDQPITVAHDFRWQEFVSIPCALLPK